MKWLWILLLLAVAGCTQIPQTFQGEYYREGVQEVGEDLDDVTGARTL